MTDRITARPDVAPGIGTRYRGDSDTFDVFRDGEHIGTVDSTRDRTGSAFGIVRGDRRRFPDASIALRYVAKYGVTDTERACSQCGMPYVARRGVGGSIARNDDAERFPFDEATVTGVRAGERGHWFNGAFCSDDCYAAAYYEPPFPYGP